MIDLNKAEQLARQVRKDILDLTYEAGSTGTHIGGSLSIVEILVLLYFHIMKINCKNLTDENRDRFILSKGHGAMAQYAVMHRVGILTDADIETFKKNGSLFSTHPLMNISKGIEFSTGSLGHGLSLAVGTALGLKKKGNVSSKVFVLVGDGECDEGSIWEAAMSASNFRLDNLILIIDRNNLQLDGPISEIMDQGSLEKKFESFGWQVFSTNGHNIKLLDNTFNHVLSSQKLPCVVIANTIKGKGVSFIENKYNWHIGMLDEDKYKLAIKELGYL